MKYNKSFADKEFVDYSNYLEGIKDKLPKMLFDFISDIRRHDLGEKSLHDSWINEISIKENRQRNEFGRWKSEVIIKIVLLGSYHDRNFEIKFSNVTFYGFEMKAKSHTDLITYEVYIEDSSEIDCLIFNAEFADGSVILIKSENIEIIEKLFDPEA